MDYIKRKHLKGKDPKARIEYYYLMYKSQGLILKHLQHFKNHIQAVHGITLRDLMFVRTSKALSDPATRVRWRRVRRMSIYHNDNYADVQSENRADFAELTTLFKNVSEDPAILADAQSVQTITQAIGLKICDLLMLSPEDLNTSASLADIGVDSLIVMEIRSWWKSTFRFSVSTLEFLSCISINEVGLLAANGLQKLNAVI